MIPAGPRDPGSVTPKAGGALELGLGLTYGSVTHHKLCGLRQADSLTH